MAEQKLDLKVDPSPDLQAIDVPVTSVPVEVRWSRLKTLLPIGFCVLIGFFHQASFVPRHRPLEIAALVLVELSILAGMLHVTSVPHAVPLVLNEVIHVMVGTLAVQVCTRIEGMTPVQGAALVGVLAYIGGRLGLVSQRVGPGSLYCGAFAGMTTAQVLPGPFWMTMVAITAGVLYSLARHFWVGVGGRLGTLAFAGTAITVLVARIAGLDHQNHAPGSIDPLLQLAILGMGAMSAPLTYWLAEHRKFGAVLASALPSAIVAFGLQFLSGPWHARTLPLAAVWLGASFAGMTSADRLAGRYWMLPLMGSIFGLLFLGSGPRLNGFGGLLGITALNSVIAALGIAWLAAGMPLRAAKSA